MNIQEFSRKLKTVNKALCPETTIEIDLTGDTLVALFCPLCHHILDYEEANGCVEFRVWCTNNECKYSEILPAEVKNLIKKSCSTTNRTRKTKNITFSDNIKIKTMIEIIDKQNEDMKKSTEKFADKTRKLF